MGGKIVKASVAIPPINHNYNRIELLLLSKPECCHGEDDTEQLVKRMLEALQVQDLSHVVIIFNNSFSILFLYYYFIYLSLFIPFSRF